MKQNSVTKSVVHAWIELEASRPKGKTGLMDGLILYIYLLINMYDKGDIWVVNIIQQFNLLQQKIMLGQESSSKRLHLVLGRLANTLAVSNCYSALTRLRLRKVLVFIWNGYSTRSSDLRCRDLTQYSSIIHLVMPRQQRVTVAA